MARTNLKGTYGVLVRHVYRDCIRLGAAVCKLDPLDSLDTVIGIVLAGRWEREINDMHLLTRRLQVFDNLPEGDA